MIPSHGYAAYSPDGKLKPFKFERRELGPKDILIDIMYCGICHSDIHEARSEWRSVVYPIVPGHEIIGKVRRVGSSVKKFKAGQIVGVGCMVESCGRCEACRADAEYACERGPVWTYDSKERHVGGVTYGGYSNNIVADERFVLRIPKGVDPAATAPLMCAGTTTFTPLRYWKVGKGELVGIIGLGGLGHVAVKLARSLGAKVVVLTSSKGKMKDAKRLGAADVIVTSDKNGMKRYMGDFDFILDTVSAEHDMNLYLPLLKRNGRLVLVGLPSRPFGIGAFSLVSGHRILAGSGLDGIKGTQQMLDYCARHRIGCDVEIIPIQKVNEAYERVVKGDVRYRFVIDLSSLKNSR